MHFTASDLTNCDVKKVKVKSIFISKKVKVNELMSVVFSTAALGTLWGATTRSWSGPAGPQWASLTENVERGKKLEEPHAA